MTDAAGAESSNIRYALSQLPTADDKPLPERLGTVRLQEMIGRGGMGRVYRGWDEALHRDVAVKFLECPDGVLDDAAIARFMEGARAAANVKHPNLTAILAADQVNGVPYLVLEFVRGQTLQEIINRRGPLTPAQALAVMEEVCGAVAGLHEANILHLDIKPSNIMLDVNGRVYLTDFGLTLPRRAATGEGDHDTAGTPPYMAPEMFDGMLSPRTDVYALGITLFQLLTGKPPFRSGWPKIAVEHRSTPLPVEELREKGVPDVLIEEIERATHKQQTFRHKGARQLREKLHGLRRASNEVAPSPADLTALLVDLKSESEDPSHATLANRTPGHERLRELAITRQWQREHGAVASFDQSALLSTRPIMDPSTTISLSLFCTVCDYDLQGLSRSGKCPECGTDKAWALRPDRLMFADLHWLKRMRGSLRWALISFFIIVTVIIMEFVATVLLGNDKLLGKDKLLFNNIMSFMSLVAASIFLFCYYRLTRREPECNNGVWEQLARSSNQRSNLYRIHRLLARILFWLITLAITGVIISHAEAERRSEIFIKETNLFLTSDSSREISTDSQDLNAELIDFSRSAQRRHEVLEDSIKARRISAYSMSVLGFTGLVGIGALTGFLITIIRRGDRRGDLCRFRGYFLLHWTLTILSPSAFLFDLSLIGSKLPIRSPETTAIIIGAGGPIALLAVYGGAIFACARAINAAIESPARAIRPNYAELFTQ